MTKKDTLSQALVDMSLRIFGFILSNKWNGRLSNRYIKNIKNPYINALVIPFFLSLLLFVKKLTVNGIIGNTQGVNNAIRPPKNPNTKMDRKLLCLMLASSLTEHWDIGLSKSMFEIGKRLASVPDSA